MSMDPQFFGVSSETAKSFGECFGQHGASLAWDLAKGMTCTEVESLAALLVELGYPQGAESWIETHAEGDEEGDMHWKGSDE